MRTVSPGKRLVSISMLLSRRPIGTVCPLSTTEETDSASASSFKKRYESFCCELFVMQNVSVKKRTSHCAGDTIRFQQVRSTVSAKDPQTRSGSDSLSPSASASSDGNPC